VISDISDGIAIKAARAMYGQIIVAARGVIQQAASGIPVKDVRRIRRYQYIVRADLMVS
jgi:hypothetical protein